MSRIWAIAALVCGVTAPGAAAAETVPTDISSFSWTDADGSTDFFDGAIASQKATCVKRRRVVLYRKEAGPDARIAGGKTNRHGVFRIEREDPGSGRYWAKVKIRRSCEGAETGLLSVTDLEGV